MVNCDMFRNKLHDFQEGNISEKLRQEMEQHRIVCKECCKTFDMEKAAEHALHEAFLLEDDGFESCKEDILQSIDKGRYGNGISKRLYFNFRKNAVSYILCAALIILCAVLYPSAVNMLNASKPIPGNSGVVEHGNNTSNSKDAPLKVKELELPLPESTKDSDAAGILNKIKGKDMGFDTWTICYSKSDKVIFYNSPGLLAYTDNGSSSEYYGAVDLEKIGCNFMSGETISMVEPSPDGNLVVIWNWDVEALVNGNTKIYIYDLANKNTKIFNRDSKDNIVGSWSSSSRYYAYGDSGGKSMTVYDASKDKTFEIPLDIGALKQLFVSDSGNAVAISDKNYLIKNIDNQYIIEELPLSGDILGFTESGNLAYFKSGSISEYDFTSSHIVKEIGSSFKLVNMYKLNGVRNLEHPMFSDGTSTIVYDLNKSFYTYNFGDNFDRYVNFSNDSKKCFVTSDFKSGEVITSDGESTNLNDSIGSLSPLNCYFLGSDSLVRIVQKNNSSMLSDFALLKYQLEK